MAQDPKQSSNNGTDNSLRATPRGDNERSFRIKYDRFVERVKLSAQKAKAEAKRKRTKKRIVNGYKHNTRIMEDLQNKRNFSLSTESLHRSRTSTSNMNDDEEGMDKESATDIMDDDWTAIVIHKKRGIDNKSKSLPPRLPKVPRSAPPPIPHERRHEIESSLSESKKRRSSLSLQNIFKRRKSKGKGVDPEEEVYHQGMDELEVSNSMTFNLDAEFEDNIKNKVDGHSVNTVTAENGLNRNTNSKEYEMVVQWEWCDDNGEWHKYGKSTSKSMEESYVGEEESYEYDPGIGRVYTIKFAEMKQYNNLNQAWDVRRKEIQKERMRLSLL